MTELLICETKVSFLIDPETTEKSDVEDIINEHMVRLADELKKLNLVRSAGNLPEGLKTNGADVAYDTEYDVFDNNDHFEGWVKE